VAAGIRQPITACVADHPDLRLIDERFMQIQQAAGTVKAKAIESTAFLCSLIEELRASGFVTDALRRAGQSTDLVAPAAS
jgi:polar amino acid transport system substrate-binding protein